MSLEQIIRALDQKQQAALTEWLDACHKKYVDQFGDGKIQMEEEEAKTFFTSAVNFWKREQPPLPQAGPIPKLIIVQSAICCKQITLLQQKKQKWLDSLN